jgi:amino acid transporter
MFRARNIRFDDQFPIIRAVHVIERSGLAMAGAMCGTFVAAQLAQTEITLFGSLGFIVAMVLTGTIGFYLGIDIPRQPLSGRRPRIDPVELLSAAGTFLAAMAAMISVYGLVFDVAPQRFSATVIGSWWVLGVIMQTGAGSIGRLRLAGRAAA